MRLPHILLTAVFFAHIGKVSVSHIFPHKLAFLAAILILFVFLLPISIRFCYLNHLVSNRMAPSTCPDLCGTRWGSWFQAILYHTSAAYSAFMQSAYFFQKCRIKLTCLNASSVLAFCCYTTTLHLFLQTTQLPLPSTCNIT